MIAKVKYLKLSFKGPLWAALFVLCRLQIYTFTLTVFFRSSNSVCVGAGLPFPPDINITNPAAAANGKTSAILPITMLIDISVWFLRPN